MEMSNNVNLTYLVDTQQNNLNLMEHKLYLDPCRNKITINLNNIDELIISKKISNYHISKMIDYLESFKFIHNLKLNDFTLYWTGLHTIIIINSNEPYLDNFIEQFKIFINKMDILNIMVLAKNRSTDLIVMEQIQIKMKTYDIYIHINTFRQTDQNMRLFIHNIIFDWISLINKSLNLSNNLFGIFLGGEMYIYGKIFDMICNKKLYLTDTKSILIDAKNNDPSIEITSERSNDHSSVRAEKSQYEIINYNISDSIIKIIKSDQAHFLIANVSKNGLGKQLTDQINKFKPLYLILINCSIKTAMSDREYLKSNYDLINHIELISNYTIILSVLKNSESPIDNNQMFLN